MFDQQGVCDIFTEILGAFIGSNIDSKDGDSGLKGAVLWLCHASRRRIHSQDRRIRCNRIWRGQGCADIAAI